MTTSIFARVRLGYVLVDSNRLDEWRRFGVDGLGLHADRVAAGAIAFRMDAHARRLIVRPGGAEDVSALGWQVDDDAVLEEIVSRLRARGIPALEGSPAEAHLRGVARLVAFTGPKRQTIELFTRPMLTPAPLQMRASGFLTGAGGMGHVAIITREPEAALAFWEDVFDARVSDRIEDRLDGVHMDFTFLRLNERHHSVAIAATRGVRINPLRNKIHHLNLQAQRLDDVTDAYLRCRKMGYSIANAIGQHPNDRELSFYVVTPSGFEMELGWNPLVVADEAAWQQATYRGISLWGHFPENLSTRVKLARLRRGLASLARKEHRAGTAR